MLKNIKKIAKQIISNRQFEASIIILIATTTILIIYETILPIPEKERQIIELINEIILYIFALEISLRLFAAKNFKFFMKECWPDLIALLPLIKVFRPARVFTLFRIFRLFSPAFLFNRHTKIFRDILKQRKPEYTLLGLLSLFLLIFGTIGFVSFEMSCAPGDAFWTTLFSIFSQEYVTSYPATLCGKIVLLIMMFSGMVLFAVITGTVSAFMVDKLKKEAIMGSINLSELENHIIVCGWNAEAPGLIKELLSRKDFENRPIVVISETGDFPDFGDIKIELDNFYFIKDDFTKVNVLEKAGIKTAQIAIIMGDKHKYRSDQDIDARTVLAALTIEKLNPKIYSCAELINKDYETHLHIGKINDIVCTRGIAGQLLAQSAMKLNIVPFLSEIFDSSGGNNLFRLPVKNKFEGKSFIEVMNELKLKYNAVLLAVIKNNGEFILNPPEYIFSKEEQILVIAEKKPVFND